MNKIFLFIFTTGFSINMHLLHSNEIDGKGLICEIDKEETIEKEVKQKTEEPTVKEETTIKQEIVEQKEIPEEYIEVEVLEDLPTFTGMDAKNYTLKNSKKEIIPIYNAKMLRDAGKVKIINEVKV